MKKFDISDFSRYGATQINMAYVRQVRHLIICGKSSRVNWPRLIEMLNYCIRENLDTTGVKMVLQEIVSAAELDTYCAEMADWYAGMRAMQGYDYH